MVSIGTILFTLFDRFLLLLLCIVLFIPALICLCLPQQLVVDNWLFIRIARFFYWFCVKFSFLPITYKGLENIPNQPCIIVANHQSGFDIPLVGNALKERPHVWLALAELTKSPILRFILPRVAVLVDTTNPVRGLRTLVQAMNIVKEKPWDLIIFPEGGRFTDGQVKEFFGGYAVIAKKMGRPVVPIHIKGIHKVYPPHSFWIHYYPVTVLVGAPMTMGVDETEEDFKQRVFNWFSSAQEGH
jgi:1-acyl-sn-glycerol-3-phosphate acyltransferase